MTQILVFSILLALAAQAADLPGETRQLIPQLGDKQFARRQAAQEQLTKLGDANPETVLNDCVRAYAGTVDPEVKARLREAMATLVETHILKRPRGFLGIRMTGGPAQQIIVRGDGPVQIQPMIVNGAAAGPAAGIQVINVTEESPAARAGVQAGDLIQKIDEIDLVKQPSTAVFTTYVQSKNPGTTVKLVIQRGEQSQALPIELGKMPDDLMAQVDPRLQDPDAFFNNWLQERLDEVRRTKPNPPDAARSTRPPVNRRKSEPWRSP